MSLSIYLLARMMQQKHGTRIAAQFLKLKGYTLQEALTALVYQ